MIKYSELCFAVTRYSMFVKLLLGYHKERPSNPVLSSWLVHRRLVNLVSKAISVAKKDSLGCWFCKEATCFPKTRRWCASLDWWRHGYSHQHCCRRRKRKITSKVVNHEASFIKRPSFFLILFVDSSLVSYVRFDFFSWVRFSLY